MIMVPHRVILDSMVCEFSSKKRTVVHMRYSCVPVCAGSISPSDRGRRTAGLKKCLVSRPKHNSARRGGNKRDTDTRRTSTRSGREAIVH